MDNLSVAGETPNANANAADTPDADADAATAATRTPPNDGGVGGGGLTRSALVEGAEARSAAFFGGAAPSDTGASPESRPSSS